MPTFADGLQRHTLSPGQRKLASAFEKLKINKAAIEREQ